MRNLKNKAFTSYSERKLIRFTTLLYSLLAEFATAQKGFLVNSGAGKREVA